MRTKEHAHDYRYFPDPDLPPLVITDGEIERIGAALPELPGARRARLLEAHGLSEDDARTLTEERPLADYFEAASAAHGDGKKIANWILGDLLRELHADEAGRTIETCPVEPAALAELVRLIDDGTISGKIAKEVLGKMYRTGEGAAAIVEREGLTQVTDEGAIEAAARDVVEKNPRQADQYRAGKTNTIGFFVGQVMKATGGKANPQKVNEVLRRLLGGERA
jgi:aspartyl-tRNA(Asn)/glutamyl-tRNA(Gln) amidotransferase subunit B